jgi:integrase/recombinase XerC
LVDAHGKVVRGKKTGDANVNRHLSALSVFMNWARSNNLTANTADKEVAHSEEQRDTRPPNPVEEKRWKAVGRKLDARWGAAQTAYLGSGMRYDELASLLPDDIVDRGIVIKKAKGKKGRTVPVSEVTVVAARKVLALGGIPKDSGGQMSHRLEVAARKAKMKPYTAHQLRHTYGTECLRNGMDLRTLQVRMGHSSIATTQKYLHALQARDGSQEDFAPV